MKQNNQNLTPNDPKETQNHKPTQKSLEEIPNKQNLTPNY